MSVFLSSNIFQALGFSWQKMLLYLINFLVLFVGLTFLLYKPVKKFMDNRKKQIADEIDEAKKIRGEAEERVRAQQNEALQKEEEIKRLAAEIEEEKLIAHEERENLLAEAKREAEEIRLAAKRDADAEREKAVLGAKNDVTDLAVALAKSILEREITASDDEKLVDECIKEWKGDD